MKKKIIFIILLLGLVVTFDVVLMSWNSEVEALSKYGSRGTEVRTIQEKLKRWGYYSGSVDGIYGSQTVSAVKSFQKKNRLTVDGIAGTQTLKAMGITSSSSSSSSSNNSSNVSALNEPTLRRILSAVRRNTVASQIACASPQKHTLPSSTVDISYPKSSTSRFRTASIPKWQGAISSIFSILFPFSTLQSVINYITFFGCLLSSSALVPQFF